jgi:hypothetical protein
MNYLDSIANAIRDEVGAGLEPLRGADALFRMYAVLAMAKGEAVTAEDVHNAWAAWMMQSNPTHSSIKPFSSLPVEVQREDEPFVDAIRKVAPRLRAKSGRPV